MRSSISRTVAAFTLCGMTVESAAAQDDPNAALTKAAEREKAKTAYYTERANAVKARSEYQQAKIDALNLPKFENKTELTGDAGKLEAAILGGNALAQAADIIAEAVCGTSCGTYVVLAGDEALDFGRPEALAAEIKYTEVLFKTAGCATTPITGPVPATADIGLVIGAVSAAAQLFASETKISAVDLNTALPSRLLATRIATRIGGYLPGAMIASPDGESTLVTAFDGLATLADCAAAKRAKLPEKLTTAKDKASAAALDRALTRYEELHDRATTADDDGSVPIIAAQRLKWLLDNKPEILRVRVEFANGTFVSTKNLWTMLGADPVRVSGGVIVSYQVTTPRTGLQQKGDVLICRTALTSLKKVHTASWQPAGGTPCLTLSGKVQVKGSVQ